MGREQTIEYHLNCAEAHRKHFEGDEFTSGWVHLQLAEFHEACAWEATFDKGLSGQSPGLLNVQ